MAYFTVTTENILTPLDVYVTGDSREDLMPEAEDIAETIPGRHGEISFGSKLKSRFLELHVVTDDGLTVAQKKQLKRDIANHLNPLNGVKALVFADEPDKTYMVKYAGKISLDDMADCFEFTIPFKMCDPFIISTTEKTLTGSGTIVNDGTVETSFIVEIIGDGTSPSVTVDGENMHYDGTLAAGDVLTIDTGKMTVTANGVNAMAKYNGVFPKLQVGDTVVTAGDNVTIKWHNRWI